MANRHDSMWTREMEQRLRTLWAVHKGATPVARAMGLTRNQVASKAQRLGLNDPDDNARTARPVVTKPVAPAPPPKMPGRYAPAPTAFKKTRVELTKREMREELRQAVINTQRMTPHDD